MKRDALKKEILALRRQGKTYSEILKILKTNLPKSTLSGWCANIKLPIWYPSKIRKLNYKNLSRAQRAARIINKKKRSDFLKSVETKANEIISFLDINNLKIILATLYAAEGAKWKSHSGLMLGSSDPKIIILYLELLNKCYGIERNSIKCRVCYRADQNINELERFWSQVTNISLENFYKTKPDPRTVGKQTQKKDYKGVCVLTCKGAHIQLELEQIIIILSNKLRAHSSVG